MDLRAAVKNNSKMAAVKSKSSRRKRESEDGARDGRLERGGGRGWGVDLIPLVQYCETANASARDCLHLNRGNVIAR
jgi:hypothetical protein